ncbi:MAG: hypothetical protein KUG51_01050 [Urechidicola sp.]|nr:hypothetical protein [Urechidicola sp.]
MKKITYIIAGLFLMMGSMNVIAQMAMSQQDCTIEYNLFKGEIQGKNFEEARPRFDNLMKNCPDLTVNIYKLGAKIVDDMIEKGDLKGGVLLMSEIYDQRIKYFPKDLAKVYSDWVSFLVEHGLEEDERVYQYLERGYKEDPTGMSPKNIYMYFDFVLERNKNIDVQKVLDTYDDINDAFEVQSGKYQQRLSKLLAKEEGIGSLGKKDAKSKRIAEGRLKNIGIIKGGLDQKIEELLTCERLVPLYRRDFNANLDNAKWLQRAVSRMFRKECTDDPLYVELAHAYAKADPSSNAYIFLSGILEDNGKTNEALEMRKKAIELEIDPVRKSKYQLTIATDYNKKGQKSKARQYANDAIRNNPGNGAAYLLIASMYASSANTCGTDEFTKRMVYVAALNKARRAVRVDPSISSRAKKYIKSYKANIPTKAMIFAEGVKEGDTFKVGCWIGETVNVEVR